MQDPPSRVLATKQIAAETQGPPAGRRRPVRRRDRARRAAGRGAHAGHTAPGAPARPPADRPRRRSLGRQDAIIIVGDRRAAGAGRGADADRAADPGRCAGRSTTSSRRPAAWPRGDLGRRVEPLARGSSRSSATAFNAMADDLRGAPAPDRGGASGAGGHDREPRRRADRHRARLEQDLGRQPAGRRAGPRARRRIVRRRRREPAAAADRGAQRRVDRPAPRAHAGGDRGAAGQRDRRAWCGRSAT